jgi:hypothetical protein
MTSTSGTRCGGFQKCVPSEYRGRRHQLFDVGEDFLFKRQLFRRRFENPANAVHRAIKRVVRSNSPQQPRIVFEQRGDRLQPPRQRFAHLGKRFKHVDVMTRRGEQIGNAVAHQTATDDANFLLRMFVHRLFLEQTNIRNCAHAKTLSGWHSVDPIRRGENGHACPALGRILVIAYGGCRVFR